MTEIRTGWAVIIIHDDAFAGADAEEIERRKRAVIAACEEILRRQETRIATSRRSSQ